MDSVSSMKHEGPLVLVSNWAQRDTNVSALTWTLTTKRLHNPQREWFCDGKKTGYFIKINTYSNHESLNFQWCFSDLMESVTDKTHQI